MSVIVSAVAAPPHSADNREFTVFRFGYNKYQLDKFNLKNDINKQFGGMNISYLVYFIMMLDLITD